MEIHAERAVEKLAAIYFLVIGLSHLVQPLAWVQYFTWLRAKGTAGMFVEGLLSLGFGSLIVAFHNVWSGLPVVVTVVGWGQVLKGLVRLVLPQWSLRVYERITPERAWHFRVAGVGAVALCCLLAYVAYAR